MVETQQTQTTEQAPVLHVPRQRKMQIGQAIAAKEAASQSDPRILSHEATPSAPKRRGRPAVRKPKAPRAKLSPELNGIVKALNAQVKKLQAERKALNAQVKKLQAERKAIDKKIVALAKRIDLVRSWS